MPADLPAPHLAAVGLQATPLGKPGGNGPPDGNGLRNVPLMAECCAFPEDLP